MDEDIIRYLEAQIRQRRTGDPATSYIARRFDQGCAKMAQKIGEEGVELALACVQKDRSEIVKESADLVFHLLLALEEAGIPFSDVEAELRARANRSGIEEKRSRGKA